MRPRAAGGIGEAFAIRGEPMKAAVTRAFGAPLVIEELNLAAPGPGEVRVRMKAVAICHSDLIFIAGGWGGTPPAVYGHEAAGEVVQVGPGVEGLAPGDRAVVTLIRSCGHCPCCARGQRTYCTEPFPLNAATPLRDAAGAPVLQGLKCGAFAEEVVVHHSQIARIGGGIGWAEASLLACGVITGWGAVANTAEMPAGATAVVIGAGGVGINSVQAAAHRGAARVIVVDPSAEKREIALGFGATDCLPVGAETASNVRAMTSGGADFVFVTVGNTGAMAQAYEMLAPGGAAVLVGMGRLGETSTFDPLTLADAGQRILGSKMGKSTPQIDIPALLSLYEAGTLKLDELVTGRFPFAEINAALDRTRAGIGVRNVVLFD